MAANWGDMSWLLARLEWPSGLVRERTCAAIAQLLGDSSHRHAVNRRLLEWIGRQCLESLACNGLLALVRAKELNGEHVLPRRADLTSALQRPSVMSKLLLCYLFPQEPVEHTWPDLHSGPSPEDARGDPFFTEHVRYYLPQQHYRDAEWLEKKTHTPFLRQWKYEWHSIVRGLGLKPTEEPLRWANAPYEGRYAAMDFRLGDVYRSAFLRALAWLIDKEAISETDSELFALPLCPIDVGLWRVKPQRTPPWWPRISATSQMVDTTPAQVWGGIEVALKAERSSDAPWVLGAACGFAGDVEHPFLVEVHGLFQKCDGPRAASAESVARWIDSRKRALHGPPSVSIEGQISVEPEHVTPDVLDDWWVLPACVRVRPRPIHRWQHWRVWFDMHLSSPCLSSAQPVIEVDEDAVLVKDGGEVIGRWVDWTNGVGELLTRNLPPRAGQVLYLKRSAVEQFTSEHGCVFCWVCRVTNYSRKYSSGDFGESETCRLFGETRLLSG